LDRLDESNDYRRVKLIARLVGVWALILVAKLTYLQVFLHEEIDKIALYQQVQTESVQPPRGRILDRNGETLAISVDVDSVAINPRQTPDLEVARDLFANFLDLDPVELQDRIDFAVRNGRGFLWIKRKLSPEESQGLRSLKLPWVQFIRETRRGYPNGAVGAHVIGTVDHEGNGNSGLEQSLDEELKGKAGLLSQLSDAQRRGIDSEVLADAEAGADFGISIDTRIQYAADSALARAAEEFNAETGSLIVVSPYSGEILAMSNYPGFDPNADVVTERDVAARKNNAVSAPFEPGSVFKMITVSAGLEATSLGPESLIDCGPGYMRLFGRTIHDTHKNGIIPVRTILAESSNIGAMQIALQVGKEHMYEYMKRFGFGEETGIPLPGESAGLVWSLDKWGRTSIGSVAMGHELLATSLQLAMAGSVFANGGMLPKPRLILWRERKGEGRVTEPVEAPKRVIEPETAIAMRRMLEGVVLEGTGSQARLKGYSSGGKTGSAQIYDPEEGHYTHLYNSSFVGFAPVQDPKIVVAVTLNGAARYGGVISAPVFREVSATALRVLGVVPDIPAARDPRPAPDSGRDWNDLAIADLADTGVGGTDDSEDIEAEEPEVTAYLLGPRVPDLRGMTLRDVLVACGRLGIEVEYEGDGLARSQNPAPGAVLPVGERVFVELAR